MRAIALSLIFCALPASAGVIGMVWSRAGSNVTLTARQEGGRAGVRVDIPSHPPCGLRVYRRLPSELDGARTVPAPDKGTPVLPLGLWIDNACFFKHYDQPAAQRPKDGPHTQLIDLEKDVFSIPGLARHKDDFYHARIRLAVCLQESAPGDLDQSEACRMFTWADIRAGKELYRSAFVQPGKMDLGLTQPRPVDMRLLFAKVSSDPKLLPGQQMVKRPTLTAVVEPFGIELSRAHKTWGYGDERYYYFYFYEGDVIDAARARALGLQDKIFCEMALSQPKALWGKETKVSMGRQTLPVRGGAGSAVFSRDPDLDGKRYWSQEISLNPSYSNKPADRTVVAYFACAKPNGGWDETTGIAVGDAYQHLKLDGQLLLKLYSDYPGYQDR